MSGLPDWYDTWKLDNNEADIVCAGCGVKDDDVQPLNDHDDREFCDRCAMKLSMSGVMDE